MSIVRCDNGHFYDNNKHSDCPYCKSLQNERNRYEEQLMERMTMAIPRRKPADESVTIGLQAPIPDDEGKTIGLFSRNSGNDFVTGWIVCIQGPEKGRDYRLHYGNNWVGRSLQMDISMADDLSITRDRHANIVYDYKSNKFFLVPTKGTDITLNGEALIRPGELKKRDRIGLGKSIFSFIPFCEGEYIWDIEKK